MRVITNTFEIPENVRGTYQLLRARGRKTREREQMGMASRVERRESSCARFYNNWAWASPGFDTNSKKIIAATQNRILAFLLTK